jgi:SAM-dependent methyltransferase
MANEEMRRYWNEAAGPEWVAMERDFDVALAPFSDELLGRAAPQPGEHALDVGCGFGTTALALAQAVGPGGHVMGIDISAPLLARARQRAAGACATNVTFREADAQDATLPPAHFDLVLSRFAIMFFDDPVAAFRNLHLATARGGRLVFACWRPPEYNPWFTFPCAAIAPCIPLPAPPSALSGPFAFGDDRHVREVLASAGWVGITIDPFDADVVQGAGGDADAVVRHLVRGQVAAALKAAPEEDRDAALRALREAVEAHMGDGPATWPGRAWMVGARRSE